jgi:uncharacterized protein (DUF169 family)
MLSLDGLHDHGRELEQRIRLQTLPLAIKVLEKENEIPEDAERPIRDLGCHIAVCQGFAKSRREGALVAMTKDDMWCPEGVIGYGLAEPPPYYFDGYHRFPQSVESPDAGSLWAKAFPRLEVGRYVGVISAPLTTCQFMPDVIVIYCDSAQLGLLLLAVASKEGYELTCTVSAKGACVYSVIPPLQTGQYQVTVPCPGDRRFAGAQHDEMIFSVPVGRVDALISSLRYLEGYGYRLPFRFIMKPEAALPENYVALGKMMGMDWMKGDELAGYEAWKERKK